MNIKQNFIAIFAIALIALGTSLLFSCNADDEEYDFNGAYTMANGVMTRSGEGGGNPDPNIFNGRNKRCVFVVNFDEANPLIPIDIINEYAFDNNGVLDFENDSIYDQFLEELEAVYSNAYCALDLNIDVTGGEPRITRLIYLQGDANALVSINKYICDFQTMTIVVDVVSSTMRDPITNEKIVKQFTVSI